MSSLVFHFQGQLAQQLSLLSVTCLSQFNGLERTQERNSGHVWIDNESGFVASVVAVHEAVRHNRDSAEIAHVNVSSADDGGWLVRRSHVTLCSDTSKSRHQLLVSRVNHQHFRRATSGVHLGNHSLQNCFCESAVCAIDTGSSTTRASNTVSATVIVGVQPGLQTTQSASSAGVTSSSDLVRQQGQFNVALQFSRNFSHLISLFRLTTSFVHSFQSASDSDGLGENLCAVADTGCWRCSDAGLIRTFNSAAQSSSSQRVGLPLMVSSSSLVLADRRHERRVGGADVINNVREVFAHTDGGIGLIGRHLKLQKFKRIVQMQQQHHGLCRIDATFASLVCLAMT